VFRIDCQEIVSQVSYFLDILDDRLARAWTRLPRQPCSRELSSHLDCTTTWRVANASRPQPLTQDGGIATVIDEGANGVDGAADEARGQTDTAPPRAIRPSRSRQVARRGRSVARLPAGAAGPARAAHAARVHWRHRRRGAPRAAAQW